MLEQFELESYYNQFLQMGVRDEKDFLDIVTDEDLHNMGKSAEYGWLFPFKACFLFKQVLEQYYVVDLKHMLK